MRNDIDDCYNEITDHGPDPFVVNLYNAAMKNKFYRTTLWTGCHLQMTLMQINPNEDIGLEVHPDVDQFIMIVHGCGVANMGKARDALTYKVPVRNGYGIFVPAGTWHNLINCGTSPMKLFTVYAPPEHAPGTVHPTKEIAEREENR